MTSQFTFNVNKYTLEKDGEFIAHLNIVDAPTIVNLLNELQKENIQLKQELNKLKQSTQGCENCEYATVYIPYFTFPHSDPYCEKGHGKCEVGKSCEDYRLIGSHYCKECTFWVDGVCGKKDCVMDADSESCVYFSKEVKE